MPELSGIEVLVLVKEISFRLRGAYVNNVYSIGENQVVRFRQPGGDDVWAIVSPRYGAWVSAKVSERAKTTSFTSSLRGEIVRAKLEDVSQVDLDRIYDFSLRAGEETKHMILELMPPGNLVVVGGEGRILLALRESRTAARRIVRGGPYLPPAQKRASPEIAQGDDVARMLRSEKTVGQALGRNLALPRKYVREALNRLSLSEGAPAPAEASRAEQIASVVRGLVEEARTEPHPCLAETTEGVELFAVRPGSVEVTKEAELLGSICDEVLLPRVLEEVEASHREEGSRKGELESTLNSLRHQEAKLVAEAARVRELARKAALSATVEDARLLLRNLGSEQPTKEISSPAAVSSLLFNRAKELERKSVEAQEAARLVSRRLSREKAPSAIATEELRREKREWYERFRWFFTSQGRLGIGGRDAQSNSVLIRHHADKNDTVYHADLFGSPFFVLKGGAEQTEEEIMELAQATISFSSAWKTGLSAADAFWVSPDQIGTSAPSGEYLPKGSFMILGKKNIVRRILVEVAVGVDDGGRVVAGPESAIATLARGYVVLAPHREKTSETAKKVVKELEPLRLSRGTSVDEVMRALPAGGGKVIRRKIAKPETPDKL